MRRKITNETWEQIYTAYTVGINLRELARRMSIPEATVLQHAKRHRWTQQIKAATLSSDVITPLSSGVIEPVQSIAKCCAFLDASTGSQPSSHHATIRVYDEAGNVIETHEHKGDFREP